MWAGFQDKKVQRPANDFDSNLRSDLAETCVKVFLGTVTQLKKVKYWIFGLLLGKICCICIKAHENRIKTLIKTKRENV